MQCHLSAEISNFSKKKNVNSHILGIHTYPIRIRIIRDKNNKNQIEEFRNNSLVIKVIFANTCSIWPLIHLCLCCIKRAFVYLLNLVSTNTSCICRLHVLLLLS